MKYTYCESSDKARIEPFFCTSWYCDADCDCGMTWDQAKGMVVAFYESRLYCAQRLTEDDY